MGNAFVDIAVFVVTNEAGVSLDAFGTHGEAVDFIRGDLDERYNLAEALTAAGELLDWITEQTGENYYIDEHSVRLSRRELLRR